MRSKLLVGIACLAVVGAATLAIRGVRRASAARAEQIIEGADRVEILASRRWPYFQSTDYRMIGMYRDLWEFQKGHPCRCRGNQPRYRIIFWMKAEKAEVTVCECILPLLEEHINEYIKKYEETN